MGMLIENEFSVSATPDETYELMVDVEQVAPCIPGAEITGRREDGAYDARVGMKMGPLSLSYKGVVEIVERDDDARRAVLKARANEQRGQGTANAMMTMQVTPEGEGSRVKVSSDILVTGRVAQMGRGIMQDVATRMTGEMAKALGATLEARAAWRASGAEGAAPVVEAEDPSAFGVASDVIGGRLKKILGRE